MDCKLEVSLAKQNYSDLWTINLKCFRAYALLHNVKQIHVFHLLPLKNFMVIDIHKTIKLPTSNDNKNAINQKLFPYACNPSTFIICGNGRNVSPAIGRVQNVSVFMSITKYLEEEKSIRTYSHRTPPATFTSKDPH